jgi:HTH-type transcriptional regulator/antitoxin HigA
LRIGEIESAKRPVDAFDPARLRAALPALRALTREPMHLALSALVEQGRDLGVSIVFVPEISGTRSFGATRWSNKNPIIQLSLRGKTADRLWRTLFHEIGHVLLHDHRSVFIESSDEPTDASAAPDIEREADGFALDVLVPRELRPELQRVEREDDAIDLADRLGIDAAIIVAELHSQHLWRWDQGNRLRHRVDENDLPGVTQPASPAVKPARLHWKVPGSEQ